MHMLTCAGHSHYITGLADHVIHDGHDTELIPRLLEPEEEGIKPGQGKPVLSTNQRALHYK